jgi:AcrR family transcriptional regulator
LSLAKMRRATGPTRGERQAVTREALLRSASHSICEHGMDGASIDRIATEAGYTKGAFYANFASKEELFLVILDEKFAAELERLEAAIGGSGEPAEEARQAAEDFLSYVDRDPEWPRLYQEFASHAARNQEFRAEFAARQRSLRARMADLFARWASAYDLEPSLPHTDIAAMTLVMADGFLLDRIIDPELDNGLYATMCEVFLRGLVAMAEES